MNGEDRNTKVVKEVGKKAGQDKLPSGDALAAELEAAAAASAKHEHRWVLDQKTGVYYCQGCPETYPAVPPPTVQHESFEEFVRREGPRIVKEVVAEALEGRATGASGEADERMVKDQQAIDALDEEQISQELQGRVITQYFYKFPISGREVTGISQAGVKRIARIMAQHGEAITISSVEFETGEDDAGGWIGCLARSRNMQTGEERFGYAAQALTMRFKSGEKQRDQFAKVKALNKAQRNAVRAFIPEAVIVEMYKAWEKLHGDKRA